MRKAKFIYNYIMIHLCGIAITMDVFLYYNGKEFNNLLIVCFFLAVYGIIKSSINILSLYKNNG
jgi:hypothetical protein